MEMENDKEKEKNTNSLCDHVGVIHSYRHGKVGWETLSEIGVGCLLVAAAISMVSQQVSENDFILRLLLRSLQRLSIFSRTCWMKTAPFHSGRVLATEEG